MSKIWKRGVSEADLFRITLTEHNTKKLTVQHIESYETCNGCLDLVEDVSLKGLLIKEISEAEIF